MEIIKWAFIIGGPAYVFWSCYRESKREARRLAKHDQE